MPAARGDESALCIERATKGEDATRRVLYSNLFTYSTVRATRSRSTIRLLRVLPPPASVSPPVPAPFLFSLPFVERDPNVRRRRRSHLRVAFSNVSCPVHRFFFASSRPRRLAAASLSLSRPRLGAYRRSSRWRSRWRARCYRRTSSWDAVSPATRARLRVSERLSARRRPRTRARARSRARAMRRSTRRFVSIRERARARGRGRRPRGTSRRRDRATSAESTRRTRRKVLITDASGRE